MPYTELERRLGVQIEPQLLELALTHRSYAYEHGGLPSNERLEFLGDAVLGFVVTAHIHETLTDLPEGELTKVKNAVVSARALASIASELGLGQYLRLGKGEETTGGRRKPNLLADAFEAVLGAVFVSRGIDEAKNLVARLVFPLLADPDSLRENSDPKTSLQERTQAIGKGAPSYETRHEGPDHERTFFSRVFVDGVELGQGTGRSKKIAETEAAVLALRVLSDVIPEQPAKPRAGVKSTQRGSKRSH